MISFLMLPFSTRFFCWLGLSFGAWGGGYFLTLLLGLHFIVAVVIAVGATGAIAWWLLRDGEKLPSSGAYIATLFVGTSLLLYRSLDFLEKHGGWDAWALWNYHARMLVDPQRWQNLFQPLLYDHPDYPLCLPAGLAFLMRAFPGADTDSPSIVVAFAGMLAVALLLFNELFRKRAWVGITMLFLLSQDDVFLRIAVSQYADTLLSFYLLAALVAMDYITTHRQAAVIAGATLGLCMWTKNEGLILAVLTAVCFAPRLLKKGIGLRFLAGISLPLAWWLIFNIGYAPPNDLSGRDTAFLLEALFQPSRFVRVWDEMTRIVQEQYALMAWLVLLCIGLLIAHREPPPCGFVLVLLVFLAYCGIFLISPYDPEWHVRTALSRLIHQLVPALLYVCGSLLAKYRILPAEKLPR